MSEFQRGLEHLLNEHSMENGSNTPDFILAQFLKGCLEAYNTALTERDRWYGERQPVFVENPIETALEH